MNELKTTTIPLFELHTMFSVDPDFVDAFAARHADLHERLRQAMDNHEALARAGYDVVSDVAVIRMTGLLGKHRTAWTCAIGGTAFADVKRAVADATADSSVRAILLVIDSPGGTVAGLDGLAQQIRLARQHKPVVAYLQGEAAGAAYLVACECQRVFADVGAVLGPVAVAEIVTGWMPSAGTMADVDYVPDAAVVESMRELLLSRLAEARGLDAVRTRILADGRFVSEQAEAAGLVDSILPLDAAIDRLHRADLE